MLNVALVFLGGLHALNGIAMIVDPSRWYRLTPGVAATGPPNAHFIVDIGFAYLASGVGLMFARRPGVSHAALVLAGAVWPTMHAIFHVAGWLVHGLPSDAAGAAGEGLGVVFAGFSALALALIHARDQGVFDDESAVSRSARQNGADVRL